MAINAAQTAVAMCDNVARMFQVNEHQMKPATKALPPRKYNVKLQAVYVQPCCKAHPFTAMLAMAAVPVIGNREWPGEMVLYGCN